MKKQLLTCALALCVSCALCACGGSGDIPVTPDVPISPPIENVTPPENSQPIDTSEPISSDTPEPAAPEEPAQLKGLVFARPSNVFMGGSGGPQVSCEIYCFDPDTGREDMISSFSYSCSSNGEYYYQQLLSGLYLGKFSSDYRKLALTKYYTGNGETHAGWLDENGNFFDVTEALGLQSKSDFDNKVRYYSMGFSDGMFTYTNGFVDADRFYVPIDNITPATVQEGDIMSERGHYDGKTFHTTSWIDDTHCIINKKDYPTWHLHNSLIFDTTTQTSKSYIPGDSRNNWNGVISPDKTQIAFMSEPINGTDKTTDVYIISVDGSNPMKVTGYSFTLASRDWSLMNGINPPGEGYVLIDWI